MPPPAGPRVRPIQRFAEAVAKCAPESAAYGQCILADYKNVTKDMCVEEFRKLKECYDRAAKKK